MLSLVPTQHWTCATIAERIFGCIPASRAVILQPHCCHPADTAQLLERYESCFASAQGEREFVKDNKSLGNFRLDGIPSAPRGVPQVEVKFDIDANGILSVTATDKGTGKKQDIKITGASTLGGDEVDRMVGEAEKYAEEDKARREAVDTKNQVSHQHQHSHLLSPQQLDFLLYRQLVWPIRRTLDVHTKAFSSWPGAYAAL